MQINIRSFGFESTDLKRQVELATGLLDCVISEVSDANDPVVVSQELGKAAAGYFDSIVKSNDSFGFSWGNSLAAMADNISPQAFSNVSIVQLVGGLGEPATDTSAIDIAQRVAKLIDARLTILPAPGIVESTHIRDAMLMNKHISYALDRSKSVKVAFVGIGTFRKDALLMRSENILTWEEVNPLIAQGAVGDIALRFFDKEGRHIASSLDERTIGVDLADLSRIERVVGIAGGEHKYEAILGAIRGNYVNCLVTDVGTARKLIHDFSVGND